MTPVRNGGPASGEERGQAQRFLRGRRELRTSLLIGLCCLLVYSANRRAISAGDTYPARYLPFAIWQYHSLRLDPIATLTAQGRGDTAFWMVPVAGGHTISLYPVVVPVLIAPLYLPAVGYLHLRGWTDERLDHIARIMEKLSASLVTALSASLLYLLLRRRAAAPIALLLTLAYAFGTTTWVISSQALWQHGMAELLVIGALLLLTGPCTAPRALAAGLLCGLIAGNRPPDVILAAALGAYGLFWAGRRAALLAAAAALPMGLVLLYNLGVAGHFAGGYGLKGKAGFFRHDLLSGLGGLLFSPARGLFVFSPFLLFLVLAWRHLPRDRGERALTLAISAGVALQVLLYAKTDWRGGISWGPRYLTDLLPLLLWMLVPVVAALHGLGRTCFLVAVGAAVAIEAIGAFCYTGATDSAIFAAARGPHQMRAAWDWRNAPFVASLQEGLAPTGMMIGIGGGLDAGEDLDGGFRTAAARLRAHQQGPGYWLTAYTSTARFQEPRQEMNTFLTALLLDLLDPLAATGDLGDSLQRARQHLTGQIEAGGLVRYHGLPDAPGIGTLGCVITPDTDDTALVWRLAPDPDRRRLPAALATIDQYRTREGLYRSWLAPREAYQCLDPGGDPNPTDIAIQMHLLLLLAKVRPPAGRALCEALRPVVDQDRVWVYYRMAPLVPILRRTDLQRAGCELELPESRLRTPVPGQEIWVSLVRLLGRTLTPEGPPTDAAEIQAVLRQLAKDDFALLRKNPPLLYHNDLTATVPRYYWSEDVGYALWLRLAYEHAHRHPRANR
jgi:hypothetical protein